MLLHCFMIDDKNIQMNITNISRFKNFHVYYNNIERVLRSQWKTQTQAEVNKIQLRMQCYFSSVSAISNIDYYRVFFFFFLINIFTIQKGLQSQVQRVQQILNNIKVYKILALKMWRYIHNYLRGGVLLWVGIVKCYAQIGVYSKQLFIYVFHY